MRSRWLLRVAPLAVAAWLGGASAFGQVPTTSGPGRPFEIVDNSFLIEEAFNQEAGIVQTIVTWSRTAGAWEAAVTQEWPLGGQTHQFSFTLPFSSSSFGTGIDDALLNYRIQLATESAGSPAVAPRLSLVMPTGSVSKGRGNGVVGLQTNVPISKQFGDVYLHWNAGVTWLPRVEAAGRRTTLTSPAVGVSAIWRTQPMFNLMIETVAEWEASVSGSDTVRELSVTISPGFRRGWNLGPKQLVVGAALPVERSADRTAVGVLTYFSYELPFR